MEGGSTVLCIYKKRQTAKADSNVEVNWLHTCITLDIFTCFQESWFLLYLFIKSFWRKVWQHMIKDKAVWSRIRPQQSSSSVQMIDERRYHQYKIFLTHRYTYISTLGPHKKTICEVAEGKTWKSLKITLRSIWMEQNVH